MTITKNKIFLLLSIITVIIWGAVIFAYYFTYVNFEVRTKLPDWKEELLTYIKTLKTYPEFNNSDYWSGKINIQLSSFWSSYESCDSQNSDMMKKVCRNTFVSKTLEKLVNDKWMVKKEVCEEIEKRFGKNEQRNRCYMHYGTVMGDMSKNISFCKYLPTEKELWINKKNISKEKNFYNFSSETTKENCEFIVYYATIGSDEYNWTYLDKVKKSDKQYDSVIYQKTLNKYWNYNYITRNIDEKPYEFIMDGDWKEFEQENYQILQSIYSDLKSKFLIK